MVWRGLSEDAASICSPWVPRAMAFCMNFVIKISVYGGGSAPVGC